MTRRGVVLLLALLLAGCASIPEGLTPVQGFEVARYAGRWYEIARIDHRFERGLSRVTAEYLPGDDGGLVVLNRGYSADKERWKTAVGRAYLMGSADVGRLKVSFFGPFWSGYNIIQLDSDYRHAMIAGDTRDYLWILAREPVLSPPVLQLLLARADELGFDTSPVILVDQSALPE